MYKLGLIGNCHISALIDEDGAIKWLCLPRPDSPPALGSLLDPDGGSFGLNVNGGRRPTQVYLKNTNILVTTITSDDGSSVAITDFCPRFEENGRMFCPPVLIRIVRPTLGTPRLTANCRVINGWEKAPVDPLRGANYLSFRLPHGTLHVSTNMPLAPLVSGEPTPLTEPVCFIMSWDTLYDLDLVSTAHSFLERTETYWRRWVKHCTIPVYFQEATIRSALALKLHCYESSGAILAATTTSLPEQLGGVRNWDYRFCWLRDAFFTLSAFHSLGHFEEMEGFLRFILNVVSDDNALSPVYAIDRTVPGHEEEASAWRGYADSRPVRFDNQAANQVQNDVYGELLLALQPIYRDERFYHLRSDRVEAIMLWLGRKCAASVGTADAGIWELRGVQREHSFTNLMSWAGLDRLLALVELGTMRAPHTELRATLKAALSGAQGRLNAAVVAGSLRNGPTDAAFDASALMLSMLGYPDRALRQKTLAEIGRHLSYHSERYGELFLFRYQQADDFGVPADPFLICSFWLVQSLAKEGEVEKARALLDSLVATGNHLGLFSEHYSPDHKQQLGNFPQAYSHVGMINAAFAVSPRWSDVL